MLLRTRQIGQLLATSGFFLCTLISSCQPSSEKEAMTAQKPRTIITTDGEVDDMDSFVRMLLYANDMQIEGLVYSSSQFHYAGDGRGTLYTSKSAMSTQYGARATLRWNGTTWMEAYLDDYAKVWPNLRQHDASYPSAESLKNLVRIGNIAFEGDMAADTPGSDLIKERILDPCPDPLYIQIWGGSNSLARALKSIEEQYRQTPQWDSLYKEISSKVVLYTILDQDNSYSTYIAPNWPDIKIIYNFNQFWSFAYAWPRSIPADWHSYINGTWFKENILDNHGPLMANYYTWGDGRSTPDPEHTYGDTALTKRAGRMAYDFISEGDSPSFFILLDMGLRSLENLAWGGLGGRFVPSKTMRNRWEDGQDVTDFNPFTKKDDRAFPQTRWIPVLQNDFAARADWCVNAYEDANHAPIVTLKTPYDVTAKAGAKIKLKATATDPDNDLLTFNWWPYKEVGTYPQDVTIEAADSANAFFTVPQDAQPGQTIHLILQVSDDGEPTLAHFARVVVTVQ